MSYVGKKPVDFNDVTEAQTFEVTGDLTVDTSTLKVDSTNNRVGVGTTSPNTLTTLSANSGNTILELNRANANTTGATGAISFTASDTHSVAAIDVIGDGDDEGGILRFLTTSAASDNYYINSTTERLRIQSGGGISFNGDTAAANALDDYEEGAWTPTFSASGVSGFAYGVQTGLYVKVGQICHFSGRVTLTSNGNADSSSNQLFISNLPFTAASSGNDFVAITIGFHNSWDLGIRGGLVFPGTTTFAFYAAASTSAHSVITSGITGSHTTSTSDVIFSGTYRTT